jgi:hypothetical protein
MVKLFHGLIAFVTLSSLNVNLKKKAVKELELA